MNSITVPLEVPLRRVLDVLNNAIDSNAIGYWLSNYDFELPEGFDLGKIEWLDDNDRALYGKCRKDYFAPLVEGGCWRLHVDDGPDDPVHEEKPEPDPAKALVLDLAAVKRGLTLMAEKWTRHFGDLVSENDDAETADVFVQLCVLGDIVYG